MELQGNEFHQQRKRITRLVSTLLKFKLPTNNNISTELQEKRRRLRSALIPELEDYATNLSGHLGKLSQANTLIMSRWSWKELNSLNKEKALLESKWVLGRQFEKV